MSDQRDPLTGLTDRERLARHELMFGALLARLAVNGALTDEDVVRILRVGLPVHARPYTSTDRGGEG